MIRLCAINNEKPRQYDGTVQITYLHQEENVDILRLGSLAVGVGLPLVTVVDVNPLQKK